MRLVPSDPDVATIVGRIKDGSLDLKPDFQRGTVWSRSKQRLLVDSILRNWYVPPVHLVRTSEQAQEVLDGQQRLQSIYDFVQGRFTVDGNAEPLSEEIAVLRGLHYDELPTPVRRRFDRFTVRVFEVIDYEPSEPYELFYRLNQPTPLTEAEKRNAFFGVPREQVRELTRSAVDAGMLPERIGFTNARLAYEDVVARFVWTLELGSLGGKVTSSLITVRYRSDYPFPSEVMDIARACLMRLFASAVLDESEVRLNKATVHSWLCFLGRAALAGRLVSDFDDYFREFEFQRSGGRHGSVDADLGWSVTESLYRIFNSRATARVNDVSSVLLRDAVLWIVYGRTHSQEPLGRVNFLAEVLDQGEVYATMEDLLLKRAEAVGWEDLHEGL